MNQDKMILEHNYKEAQKEIFEDNLQQLITAVKQGNQENIYFFSQQLKTLASVSDFN